MKMYCSTPYKLWKSSVSSFFFVQTYSAQFYVTVVICSNQLSTAVVKSNSLQLLKHIFTTSCSRWKWCIKLLSLCENYVFQLFFLALQYYTPTPIPTPTPAVYLLFTYPVYALNITFCSDIITSHFFLEGGGGALHGWRRHTAPYLLSAGFSNSTVNVYLMWTCRYKIDSGICLTCHKLESRIPQNVNLSVK